MQAGFALSLVPHTFWFGIFLRKPSMEKARKFSPTGLTDPNYFKE
jgi:hypothetical protein